MKNKNRVAFIVCLTFVCWVGYIYRQLTFGRVVIRKVGERAIYRVRAIPISIIEFVSSWNGSYDASYVIEIGDGLGVSSSFRFFLGELHSEEN